jgi:anaerobic selenocysteine-containing dehydrogenase
MSCEEAWLLIQFIRNVAPDAALVMGPIPMEGEDQSFPQGATGDAVKFTILKEKCPNRRGIETLIESAGGTTLPYESYVEKFKAGEFKAAWVVGGYPKDWVDKDFGKAAGTFELLIVQDMFENALTAAATMVLPACAWVEREGSFMNAGGLVQPFERAIASPDASRYDGQYLFEIAGFSGLYTGERVRELMAESVDAFKEICEAPLKAVHAH